jgi:hypothetical protein
MMLAVTLFQTFILAISCCLVGKAVTSLCFKNLTKDQKYFIEPSIGLSVLVLQATYMGWLFPFHFLYSFSLFILCCVISCVVVWKKEILKDIIYTSGFLLLCTAPILFPLIRYDSYNPFTDIFTYLAHAQWAQQHAFIDKVIPSIYFPSESQITLYQTQGSRMGASFFLGYIQALFLQKWSYFSFPAAVSIAFSTGCLAISGLISQISNLKRNQCLFLGLLAVSLENGFLFGAQWGFFPQTFGLSFMAAFVYLMGLTVDRDTTIQTEYNKKIIQFQAPFILILSAAFLCYNEVILPFLTGILIYVLVNFISSKHKLSLIKQIIITFIGTSFLIAPDLRRFAISFVTGALQASKGVLAFGWPVNWTIGEFYSYSFGFKWSVFPFVWGNSNPVYLFPNIIFPAIVCIIIYLWFRKTKIIPKTIKLIFSINIFFFLIFLKLRYLTPSVDGGMGYTFLQFKLMKWLAPTNIALLGGIVGGLSKDSKYKTLIKTLLLIIVVTGLSHNFFITTRDLTYDFLTQTRTKKSAFRVLEKLEQELGKISEDKTIFLDIPFSNHKLTQLVCYVLNKRKIIGDFKNDGYIYGHLPQPEYDQLLQTIPQIQKSSNEYLFISYDPNKRIRNEESRRTGVFVLSHKLPNKVKCSFSEYGTESDLSSEWNWVNSRICYELDIFNEPKEIELKFEYMALIGENEKTKEVIVEVFEKNNKCVANRVFVATSAMANAEISFMNVSDKYFITIRGGGESLVLSKKDQRNARFFIKNFNVDYK